MLERLCRYNNWANASLLDTLMTNSDTISESCMLLFSHIVNAQTIWFKRINGIAPGVSVWQMNDLETCKVLLEQSANALSEITSGEIENTPIIKYTISTGQHYETAVSDILLHVFNHGTYHRAQIAKEMKLQNIKPINTDYINFVRITA
ncbi:DinB family protein [Pedobacter heparinus]|uniref:DinB family protein n=1 Tax=Pedobacter heparinus TaxID=984 RepID=UPI00292D91CD|nr:DinB family protein [Pedobacter heparinus]